MNNYGKLFMIVGIIIIIIIGIFFFLHKEAQNNNLQTVNTNLLQIQAKIKVLKDKSEIEKNKALLIGETPGENVLKDLNITPSDNIKILTQDNLNAMGLGNLQEDKRYIVDYESKEVYDTEGYKDKKGNIYHKLSDISNVIEE